MNPAIFFLGGIIVIISYFALSFLFERIGMKGYKIYKKIEENMGVEKTPKEDGGKTNEL